MSLGMLGHSIRVAANFSPLTEAFWCGLLHDTVEDGYLPRVMLRWPALDAVTRRPAETYGEFIERAAKHPVGRLVKIADVMDNLKRNGGPPRESLRLRYVAALSVLFDREPVR